MSLYGNIYKITSVHTDEIYIGSTWNTLENRLLFHEECYIKWIDSIYQLEYCTSFEILKYYNYQIELLETMECSNLKELHKREGYYQLNNTCVNMNIAGKRPKSIKRINKNPYFYCSCCEQEIDNTYKYRLSHLRTPIHRINRNNIHILYNSILPPKSMPNIPELDNNSTIILERTLDIF
jgi:hypothetical protein